MPGKCQVVAAADFAFPVSRVPPYAGRECMWREFECDGPHTDLHPVRVRNFDNPQYGDFHVCAAHLEKLRGIDQRLLGERLLASSVFTPPQTG